MKFCPVHHLPLFQISTAHQRKNVSVLLLHGLVDQAEKPSSKKKVFQFNTSLHLTVHVSIVTIEI